MTNLTPEACRAARGLLAISARELGDKTGVSTETIIKFENGRPMREANKAKLVAEFEAAGIEILNGDAPGARIRLHRLDLHQAFEEIVDALLLRRPAPANASRILYEIEASPHVRLDLLPNQLARAIRDLDPLEDRQPGTYGEAAPRVRRMLPTGALRPGEQE